MNVKIIEKSVYGSRTFYPANRVAEGLASIAGTKTLTRETLLKAKGMGMTIEFATENKEI